MDAFAGRKRPYVDFGPALPFLVPDRLFAGFNGSTRCCDRWVIHGTSRVGDGRPALLFLVPNGRRPTKSSKLGAAPSRRGT